MFVLRNKTRDSSGKGNVSTSAAQLMEPRDLGNEKLSISNSLDFYITGSA